MARLLTALVAVIAVAPLLAAPVPRHLMKDEPHYYPTRKGATWVYLVGKVEHRLVVTDVVKNRSGDGFLVSVAEVVEKERKPHRKMEVSRRGLLWVETAGGSPFNEPFFVLRCPVVAKDEWTYRTSGPGGIGDTKGTMTVVGVEEVVVPAGKFTAARVEDAYSFREGAEKSRETHWFAPAVGMVKADYGDSVWVLKSFTPGKE